MQNGTMKNSYTYGAINRLEQAVDAAGQTAAYQYNGLGYRVGKTDPENRIHYTIDLTRQYHNLLQKEENGTEENYLWDGNVAGIMEGAYYLQDELGSPIRLADEKGHLAESYGYDEFGRDLYANQGQLQPFGYTGYQADRTAGTYFGQAREYRAELGRFAGRDIIKGNTAAPYTFNEYGYCWNNPMALVDLDGDWPQWMEDAGEAISDFWNTHIYGEQITTTTSYGELEHLMYGYSQHETSSTIKSEVHTGTIIVKETTITNGKVDVGYSINMPTYNLKDGKSIGMPTSIGISAGDTGINISASIGLDLIAPKLSVNANLGFSMEELISAKVNADMGWLNNKVGLGAKLPISAWESLRLFCYKQDMKNGIT